MLRLGPSTLEVKIGRLFSKDYPTNILKWLRKISDGRLIQKGMNVESTERRPGSAPQGLMYIMIET